MIQPVHFSRRQFLRTASVAGAGLGLAAACAAPAPAAEPAVMGDSMAEAAPAAQATPDYKEMDRLHEEGVKKFLDNIGKDDMFWRKPLQFTLDGNVKVFEITCRQVDWEIEPRKKIREFTYNGLVPGPEIRVTEGDTVRVVCTNEMTESTSIHFHGVLIANKFDGVPYLTQPPIAPGTSFTYEFVARNPGSHMYHSHHNAAEQVTKGLIGSFIIEPKDKSKDPAFDKEYVMVLNDTGVGLTINGKSFPYTQPLTAQKGQKLRIRYMNEGLLIHPMHLLGMYQLVFAKDGMTLPAPYYADTLNIAPGERYDVLVECEEPGLWAFHCHVLTHAESSHGMFGMVTVLSIEA
ncbi:MAG: multicopper oxidase domain-containing protein [Chloroflexi bacterium]|nr:multicopper oxidase domain-containing protein [Chloroflexota bacterium]